jgi:hypothetical protein
MTLRAVKAAVNESRFGFWQLERLLLSWTMVRGKIIREAR